MIASFAPSPESEGSFITSNDGTFRVLWQATPSPIPLNELFDLELKIHRADDGSPVLDDVELAVDARMPEHQHGMNLRPDITRHADGGFTVSGMLFHMPGYWQLQFDITHQGITERAQADVQLD